MKLLMKYVLFFVITVMLASCKKDVEVAPILAGKWKVIVPDSDTLVFNSDSFTRKFYDGITHSYKYSIKNDAITIQYNGPLYILVQPSTHKFELENNQLILDLTNGCYGFQSKKYNLRRIE
jgi:hypothetical protein